MKIPSSFIYVVQKAINSLVQLDSGLGEKLGVLENKVIRIQLKNLDTGLFLVVADSQIEVTRCFDGHVDTTIRGTPIALASMNKDLKGLFTGDVEIEGDLETGKAIKKIVSAIEFNWEDRLSPVFGDSVSHQLGRVHRSIHSWLRRSGANASLNVADYLKDEIEITVSSQELENFCSGVESLRSSIDRFEARIARFSQSDVVRKN